jgi:hypothetical protein
MMSVKIRGLGGWLRNRLRRGLGDRLGGAVAAEKDKGSMPP